MSERERDARREKLETLRAEGVDPFPPRVGPREPVAAVHERFGERSEEELEAENGRLKRAVADLTLDKLILKEAAEGNW